MGNAAAKLKQAEQPSEAPKMRRFCVKLAPHELKALTEHTRSSTLKLIPSFSLDPARPLQKCVVDTMLSKEQLAMRLFCPVTDIEEVVF